MAITPDDGRPSDPARLAREAAVQLLFQADLNPDLPASAAKTTLEDLLPDGPARRRAWRLFAGTREVRDELDAKLSGVARNWSLKRMAATDRNVLRLGLFELLHTDAPPKVVLDEAIELARTFGSKNSPGFVNGLLDRLLPEQGKPGGGPDAGTPG